MPQKLKLLEQILSQRSSIEAPLTSKALYQLPTEDLTLNVQYNL